MHVLLLKIVAMAKKKVYIKYSCMYSERKERINGYFDIWKHYSIVHKGRERKSGASMKKAKPKAELLLSDTEPWIYQYLRDSQISLS